MDNINFKLCFKISKEIPISIGDLNSIILRVLEKEKYNISSKDIFGVQFDNYAPPLFRARGTGASKLKEGFFNLKPQGDNTLVNLEFRVPFLLLSIGLMFLLALGFIWNWGVLYLILMGIITFLFEINEQKKNAKHLLDTLSIDV